jgi:ribosomal protein S18 acetylase RimI-like enzyme
VIRRLEANECSLLERLDRSEKVRAAWMKAEDGTRHLDFIYLDIGGYGERLHHSIEVLRDVMSQGGHVYGAFDGNEAVGLASVLLGHQSHRDCSRLVSLDVCRGHRRRGIGRRLVDACFGAHTHATCGRFLVRSNPHENTIKFFRSLGFLHSASECEPGDRSSLQFPVFEFPRPFGGAVEREVLLELVGRGRGVRERFQGRISVSEITRRNCYATARLKVTDQQSFVFGSNPAYWMACSRYELGESHTLLAIEFDGFPVGMLGYGRGPDEGSLYIEPLMVDAMFQRQGIASTALELFCRQMAESGAHSVIRIGNRTDNEAAGRTYERAGFELTRVEDMSCFRERRL